MTMLKSDVQSVHLFRGYSTATAVRWSPESRPTAAVQPFCKHGEPGHCLVEMWRKVQILNEWLAKDGAAIACSGNTNHLSSKINQSIKIRAWYAQKMKFQSTPLLEKCWTFTQKTVSAHWKQVSSAAGNSTFWQHFVNIENLINGTMDLYKIWWQYSKYVKACAWLIMYNAVQVCTCQRQTFRWSFFWDTL